MIQCLSTAGKAIAEWYDRTGQPQVVWALFSTLQLALRSATDLNFMIPLPCLLLLLEASLVGGLGAENESARQNGRNVISHMPSDVSGRARVSAKDKERKKERPNDGDGKRRATRN